MNEFHYLMLTIISGCLALAWYVWRGDERS